MADQRRDHILSSFNEAFEAFTDEVAMMASLAERNFIRAMDGLVKRDDELCATAIADDEEVDQLEKQVDKHGIEILLRYQPLASDLRLVVSAMKVSNNIERISDEAVGIARKARRILRESVPSETELLESMYHHALGMFRDSVRAFLDGDLAMARSLRERDKVLDQLHAKAADQFTERMGAEIRNLGQYIDLLFISRHLERVGDHAKNIAEEAVFATAAEDIRHQAKVVHIKGRSS